MDTSQILSKGEEALNTVIPLIDNIATSIQPVIKPLFISPIGALVIYSIIVFLLFKLFHNGLKAFGIGLILLVIFRALVI